MSDRGTRDPQPVSLDVREIVREAISEFVRSEQRKAEPAYKAELLEERKRRESFEAKLNQLAEENRLARAAAEETDRHSQIRTELQRMGVAKLDLAFRAVKDDIVRNDDGSLRVRGAEGRSLSEHIADFVHENPELLPARIAGGSGAHSPVRGHADPVILLDSIRPDMNKDELERARQQIAKLANHTLQGRP